MDTNKFFYSAKFYPNRSNSLKNERLIILHCNKFVINLRSSSELINRAYLHSISNITQTETSTTLIQYYSGDLTIGIENLYY